MKPASIIKSAVVTLAAMAGLAMQPTMASTYTINSGSVNVGEVDTLKASASLSNSGDQTEIEWIQDVLGASYTMSSKFDVTEVNWVETDQNSKVYATDLGLGAGDYFFIKIGNNAGTTDTHFLFNNLDSLAWAVINLESSFGSDLFELKNIGKVSHIGNVGVVPLPAAAWLFGSALIGFITLSNRRKL